MTYSRSIIDLLLKDTWGQPEPRLESQLSFIGLKHSEICAVLHYIPVSQANKLIARRITAAMSIPSEVWVDVAVDFITGLPMSFGYTVIMVVVDRLSKFVHFMALKGDYTSKPVAETFMNYVVKLHGCLDQLYQIWVG